LVQRALDRLELVCDSYLSVATPVQLAVGTLLERTAVVTDQIRRRVRANYATLRSLVRRFPACGVLHAEAGWYAVVQIPALRSEESLVITLIERDRVLVHPGYFFDFPREAFLVISLLPEPETFVPAVTRVLTRASG
jgi:aspartate/methionine/tyrosine aminotransferase